MRLHKLFPTSAALALALGACGPGEPEAVEEPAVPGAQLETPAADLPRLDPEGAILDDGIAEGQVLEPTVDPGPDTLPRDETVGP